MELREEQLSLARLMGDESLVDTGGPNSGGLRAGALIDQESRTNDVTHKLLPLQGHTAYGVSDSSFNVRSKTAKAGCHGPELSTVENPEAVGVRILTCNTEGQAGATSAAWR